MSQPLDEFNALLAKARTGDQSALAQLARQYEPEIRVVARVLVGPLLRPYVDSLDLVQSVHRSLLIGVRNQKFDFDNPDGLIALALTMVRRKAARQWRKHQRQQRLDAGPAQSGNLPEMLAGLSTPQGDPAGAAAFRDAVERLCRELDDTERRVLELRLQGFSTAEAARELGLDGDVLRVRLHRLRQRLHAKGVLAEWL